MRKLLPVIAACLLTLSCRSGPDLKTWFVDPLIKVFPDERKGWHTESGVPCLVARNGHASLQLAILSSARIPDLTVTVKPPANGSHQLEARVRWAGYVPVGSNPPGTPYDEIIRTAPALYPDPLFEQFPFSLEGGRTTPIWVTVHAPPGAKPGRYSGELSFTAAGRTLKNVPFSAHVTGATVPEERSLRVTNWFWLDKEGLSRHFQLGDDETRYWELLANFGRVLAEHRQNVILTPVTSLAKPSVEGGTIRWSFDEFDRWVETFRKAGVIGTIEGGHLLGRASGYQTSLVVPSCIIEGGKPVWKQLDPDDPRAEAYLDQFLSALYAHLKQKGWQTSYIQHIHDEPHEKEAPYYNRYAKIIRRNLPGVPSIDAVSLDQDIGFFSDVCDIWVPVLGSFDQQFDAIREHVAKGGEAWFYTCIGPQGRHLNRFIDLPLVKTRLLHWFNFRHNMTGFLHWGGNYWPPKPLKNVQPMINDNHTLLPAGDNAIVYPDRDRLSILSSIRFEAMREGIEDYELLSQLAKRDPGKAAKLAQTAIPHVSDYVRDVGAFRKLERQLLEVE